MLENEFEKKVQEQMEEFRLRPSGSVWNNVEKELKEKKRRRIVFFWFLFAGIGLLGYSGYRWSVHEKALVAANTDTQKPLAAVPAAGNNPGNGPATPVAPGSAAIQATGNTNNTIAYNTTSPGGDKPGASRTGTIAGSSFTTLRVAQPHRETKAAVVTTPPVTRQSVAGVQTNSTFDMTVEPGASSIGQLPVKKATTMTAAVSSQQGITKYGSGISQSIIKPATDSIANATAAKAIATGSRQQTDSSIMPVAGPTAKPVDKTSSKKYPVLQWGTDIATGVGYNRSGLFSLSGNTADKSLQEDLLRYNTAAGYTAVQPPSHVRPGIAFKAGVALTVKVSPRSSVISGLRYAYYSEKIKVGTSQMIILVSSGSSASNPSSMVPRSAYGGYTEDNYTNRYHHIELPILYQVRLGKKLPVSWSAGIAARYLVGTNALVYDTAAGGIYYKDNAAFNKFQLAVQTGFSVQAGSSKKKTSWSIGPDISFDLTRQGKQHVIAGKRFLFYGGITGRMFFNKPGK